MRKILLSSLWLILAAAVVWGADAAVTESSTGKSFPAVRRVATDAGDAEVVCVGTGVRTKLVIKVYALGFYVEEAYRQKVRPGWQKQAPTIDRLQETPAFFDSLMRDAYVRQFELQFVREVEADKIQDAFGEGYGIQVETGYAFRESWFACVGLCDDRQGTCRPSASTAR